MREFHSKTLGETIALLDDDEGYAGDLVPYTRSEMAQLLGMRPDELRKTHEVKKAFNGKIIKKEIV